MAMQTKKRNDVDSLLADLGVLEMPDGVVIPGSESMAASESEDPYAKWLTPQSESLKQED
ncbi:hypothetical protein OfM1_01870 [Lactovum odontotermitis]